MFQIPKGAQSATTYLTKDIVNYIKPAGQHLVQIQLLSCGINYSTIYLFMHSHTKRFSNYLVVWKYMNISKTTEVWISRSHDNNKCKKVNANRTIKFIQFRCESDTSNRCSFMQRMNNNSMYVCTSTQVEYLNVHFSIYMLIIFKHIASIISHVQQNVVAYKCSSRH